MSAASQIDGPAAKRGKLTECTDPPSKPLINYTKLSDTQYCVEFERHVPGHGPLRFKLSQTIMDEDNKKFVDVAVRCVDLDWRQIDDTRFRLFIRRSGRNKKSYSVNGLVDPDDGIMWGVPRLVNRSAGVESLCCWIEECDYNVGWNKLREIQYEPATFGGPAGRFVLQAADGSKRYVHYSMFADCSPVLKRCMDANHDQIADGVPFKLECSSKVMHALLYLVYLNNTCNIKDNICGTIAQAHFLEMFGVVHKLMKIMCEELNNQSFERLVDWFECAAKYDLDKNKLEVEILKQMGVLARDDEKKELLRDQMKEYVKKHPDKVADLACEGLFK